MTPIVGCEVYGERTAHHPVAGMIVRGQNVDIYVHENVPGIAADRVNDRVLRRFPYLRQPGPRLLRYTLSKANLLAWTTGALLNMSSR